MQVQKMQAIRYKSHERLPKNLPKSKSDPKISPRRIEYENSDLINTVSISSELVTLLSTFNNVCSWSGGYIYNTGNEELVIIVYLENGTYDNYSKYPKSVTMNNVRFPQGNLSRFPLYFTEGSIELC